MRPSKPYHELSLSELADAIGELTQSETGRRMEINMALAEVYTRLPHAQDGDARQLDELRETLHRWLDQDDDRRMGGRGGWHDLGPLDSNLCMCSIERLETRAKRGD